nr:hypothetical protein [uncultured Prevotella sp.]
MKHDFHIPLEQAGIHNPSSCGFRGENIVVYRRDLESLPGKDSIGNIRCMV